MVGLAAGLAVAALVWPSAATASQVEIFRLDSQEAFLAGDLSGVSVDPAGRLELADRAERVTAIAEPFLFSAAAHPDGWVVGTGNEGRVLLVSPDGRTQELLSVTGAQVFAVHADDDGTVYAGVSPGGRIYRLDPEGAGDEDGGDGESETPEPWLETGETYVWGLARSTAPGAPLLVATGTAGKLLAVDDTGDGDTPSSRVLFDSSDTHLRSLEPLPGGDVLVGTAGEGLILRISPDGSARTLYDATQPEVVALARGAGGVVYAAAIASEASSVDLAAAARSSASSSSGSSSASSSSGSSGSSGSTGSSSDDGEATVSVSAGPSTVGSRPASYSGDRSQLLRLGPSGVVEPLGSFDDETVFDLLWTRGQLWVGTGLEGQLYRLDGDRMVLEKDLDERQVVALLPARGADGGDATSEGPVIVTTNAPAIYVLGGGKERRGTYTSSALDAESAARFGTLRLTGDVPRGSEVRVSFRSGMSSDPDQTWSDWTSPRGIDRGGIDAGGEVSLAGVPRGRYFQWRAELVAAGERSPRIDGVDVSYRQENLAPRIESFAAMEPGEVLLPAGFNPVTMVFEPTNPARDGIFTSLEKAAGGDDARLRTLYKLGYRTFRWEASDPNEDELEYALEFRRDEDGGDPTSADGWLSVADEIEDQHYGFDASVLPDGRYRFRLVASDAPDNPPGGALTARDVSETVVVDHTPPRLVSAERSGDSLTVVLEDALNPMTRAEVSVDAGAWRPVTAVDGLLDGRRETLEVELPEGGAHLVLLRVLDAAANAVTYDLSTTAARGGEGGR